MKTALILAVMLAAAPAFAGKGGKAMSGTKHGSTYDDAALRKRLTPEQYRVAREGGTEPAFHNEYWNNHEPGLYVDVVSGQPLFSSTDKFDSGTGWPSFTRPVDQAAVRELSDDTFGMRRVEVRSTGSDSHLGHVFEDGPKPTGLRFCINSAALRFVPVKDLAKDGYGKYLPLFQKAKR